MIDIVGNVDSVGNVNIVDIDGNVDIVGNVDLVGNVDIVDNVDMVFFLHKKNLDWLRPPTTPLAQKIMKLSFFSVKENSDLTILPPHPL